MRPEAKIIVIEPSRIPWTLLLLAVVGGIALVVWSGLRTERKPGSTTDSSRQPTVQLAMQIAPQLEHAVVPRQTELSTDVLCGNGISIADWLQKITAAAPGMIRYSPEDFVSSLPPLRICEFEGDTSLPIGEALDLLRFAGVTVAPINGNDSSGFEVGWGTSHSQFAAELNASTDLDSLTWGALRAWQRVTFKIDAQWRSSLGDPKTPRTLDQLRSLAWAARGEICRVEIFGDGHVAESFSNVPESAELDATLNVLAANLEKSECAFDVVFGLSAFASADSRTERAIAVLLDGLNSSNMETRRMSAWALGLTSAVPAVEALVGAIENANCPPALASAALIALAHSEKSSRQINGAALGADNASRRQAAYLRLRKWLALPRSAANGELSDKEYAAAFVAAAESFRVDAPLPHLEKIRAQREQNNVDPLQPAGPGWLHVPFEAGDALKFLRSGERRKILAALWRWNRIGADAPTALSLDDLEASLADSMKSIQKASPSDTQRRLALEALFRPNDARLGGEPRALCDESALALNAFLSDSSPAVQRSAAILVGKLAGTAQLQMLIQANIAARPPAGTDQLLYGLVQRFWLNPARAEDSDEALTQFLDTLLAAEDPKVAERAAWAKMQNPLLGASEKLRAAKAMPSPSLRAAALKAIHIAKPPADVPAKFVGVFLYDNDAIVREAVFSSHLPQLVQHGAERTKLYARGLQDKDASVRLAVLNSRFAIAPDSREALGEQIKVLAEHDATQEVRTAAFNWLSPGRIEK